MSPLCYPSRSCSRAAGCASVESPRDGAMVARVRSRLAGGLVLASLGLWWFALATWAQGASGYLGVPGVGTSAFGWFILTGVMAVMGLIGLPAEVRSRRGRQILLVSYLVLAAWLVVPNAVGGAADGISTRGLVVAVISLGQVVLLAFGIPHASPSAIRGSSLTPALRSR